MVASGTFREDLLYRLNVFPIMFPPARTRRRRDRARGPLRGAISSLCGKNVRRISTPALEMLTSYSWPGNVRELENVIERAMILSDDDVIHQYNLPPSLQTAGETGTA